MSGPPRKNPRKTAADGPLSVRAFRRCARQPRIRQRVVLGNPPGERGHTIVMERRPPSRAWAIRPDGARDAARDRWLAEGDFAVLRYRAGAWREFISSDVAA